MEKAPITEAEMLSKGPQRTSDMSKRSFSTPLLEKLDEKKAPKVTRASSSGEASWDARNVPGSSLGHAISKANEGEGDSKVLVDTRILVRNIHCSACSSGIKSIILALEPEPRLVDVDTRTHEVVVHHPVGLPWQRIVQELLDAEFEIDTVATKTVTTDSEAVDNNEEIYYDAGQDNNGFWGQTGELLAFQGLVGNKKRLHVEVCKACRDCSPSGKLSSSQEPNAGSAPPIFDTFRKINIEKQSATEGILNRPGAPRPSSRPLHQDANSFTFPLKGNRSTQLIRSFGHQPATTTGSRNLGSRTGEPSNDKMLPVNEKKRDRDSFIRIEDGSNSELELKDQQPGVSEWEARFSIEGMTCAACSSKVQETLDGIPEIKSVDVNLMGASATIRYTGTKEDAKKYVSEIEDLGYGCELEEIVDKVEPKKETSLWEARYSIEGMTCAACSSKIQELLNNHPDVVSGDVNLMGASATIQFSGKKEDANKFVEEIEDMGYGCELEEVADLTPDTKAVSTIRKISLKVTGMRCGDCPRRVMELLDNFREPISVESPISLGTGIVTISYTPSPPDFTIRDIAAAIRELDPDFQVTVYHPPTMEERARKMQRREQLAILWRLVLSTVVAIPTFVLGIVAMTLLPKAHPLRVWAMEPIWAGSVVRVEWALLILATPIQFFAADVFHRRAIKEIRALWRPGSKVPYKKRFLKFGSMSMLVSLGVSIAYFASVALLARAAIRQPPPPIHEGMIMPEMEEMPVTSYFDATVFLTFFLLIGRFLESYSKAKTADAVSLLAKLKPNEAQLVTANSSSSEPGTPISQSSAALEKEIASEKQQKHVTYSVRTVNVDMLEAGDIISIAHGVAPPADGVVVDGETEFDESSLTGESLPVRKEEGDTVYAGTINKGKPVQVRIESVDGTSMLDNIVRVVREGQTKRAPMERVADKITGYFVPVVVFLGISTFLIWLSLGISGSLPEYYLDTEDGGWPVWALEFAIAVFVIACPCGIGLAAPTALFVGSGLAAQNGILARGGGEAFQEASMLDCIVFDKTGTLTVGEEPVVTDHRILAEDENVQEMVISAAKTLEEASTHPLARAVVNFCESRPSATVRGYDVSEVPGRGLKGVFSTEGGFSFEAIIGNEAFMEENEAYLLPECVETLDSWKDQGKSVMLLAIKSESAKATEFGILPTFTVYGIFAAADPLRPESKHVVQILQKNGLDVWMLSGDNQKTAQAVAQMVGIKPTNVIAGVLPTEKADKIKYLQKTAPKRNRSFLRKIFSKPTKAPHRATVAMVGDGINDAPALTMSDVGIAIGSGSDVAISSAKFILLSSDLRSILILTKLSRKVFSRVKFNFFWACIYNCIGLPIAAGVLYPYKQTRLGPVWAALAMALSSVSVVCSSLLLKTKLPGVGFRADKLPIGKAGPKA